MQDTSELPRYRWVIVSASALTLALAMGAMVNGLSAFVIPLEELHGWDRGDISLINVAGLLGMAFGGLFMGRAADRFGTRPLVLTGSVVLAMCFLATSFANALWHYYLLMFVAGFFGAAAIFPPIMAALGNWFPVGAGLAIGIASAGQALGQGGVPYLSSLLIGWFGVSGAFAIIGLAMFAVLVPLALIMRPPPRLSVAAQSSHTSSGTIYLPPRTVMIFMSAAILLCCTCMSVPLMHLVPLIQGCGFALEQASSVLFSMLLVAIAGRVAFGKLADIIGALPAYMTATAWMTLLVFGFTQIESLGLFYGYAMVYGFGYAGVMTGVLVSIAALTHPSKRGTVMGVVTMFGWFGHANGGYLGGWLYDLTASYSEAYAFAAASGVLNLVIVATLYMKTRQSDGVLASA
ncbi:MAG: MFS transporter [Salaquimonas sp.]|jgi:MFS family permease|nr:MFS transporter [Salaquimonas sp.]